MIGMRACPNTMSEYWGETHDTRKLKLDDVVQCLDRLVPVDLHGVRTAVRWAVNYLAEQQAGRDRAEGR